MKLFTTWLVKQDLGRLNSLHKEFHGIGESTTDRSDHILHGHSPGGVAILWKTEIEHLIKEVRFDVDWAIGIELNVDNKKIVIINVHTPYESNENENEYLNRLAHITPIIDGLDTTVCMWWVTTMLTFQMTRLSLPITCMMLARSTACHSPVKHFYLPIVLHILVKLGILHPGLIIVYAHRMHI